MVYILLVNKNQKENTQYIFEQYKLYVEMADRISQRRTSANIFFLSINTVIMTVVGTLGVDINKYGWVIALVGIILSYTWYYTLQSYKLLNLGKFEVIHQIEEKLPLNLYSYEWYILGEGKNRSKYWPLSHLEKIVPIVFGIIFVIFEIITVIGG